ncbi:type II toxin-antitoxin system PemK/MazF family toxin [Gloeobacter morelensis MG652769]|uniref:mRNA interferase n=1 Tax=Gloeobacter morelensis MG652769 TaxID=2781736 RepID=A0ABY3PTD7_9CYAN|nr:type II toxin-antitoxin system PemK/MazF family toxin [Gloeobacter morelensis MG652769]
MWLADLDPTRGREQAGRRPCLVVSADPFNRGPAQLVVILFITSRDKGIPFHVGLEPPEGGVTVRSFIKCEDVRSISPQRLTDKWGAVRNETLLAVEDRLRILLSL